MSAPVRVSTLAALAQARREASAGVTAPQGGVTYREVPEPTNSPEDFDPFYRNDIYMDTDWDQ